MESIEQIRRRVIDLANILSAPTHMLPTYGATQDSARPHIEVDDNYHYVVVERGVELDRKTTRELDQLLSWIFADVTFQMACEFEVRNRKIGEDSRRQMFASQIDYLKLLSPAWAQRERDAHNHILKAHPYRDEP